MDEVSRNAADPLASKNLTNIELLRLRQAGTCATLVLRAIAKGAKGNAALTTSRAASEPNGCKSEANVRLVTKYSSVAF